MRPTPATRRAEQLLGVAVVSSTAVGGGDVATTTKLRLSDGTTAVVKTMVAPPAGLFAREAAGLRWLTDPPGGVAAPWQSPTGRRHRRFPHPTGPAVRTAARRCRIRRSRNRSA